MIEVPDEPELPEIASLICIDFHQTIEFGGHIADQIVQAILNLEQVANVEIVSYVGGRKRENETRARILRVPENLVAQHLGSQPRDEGAASP